MADISSQQHPSGGEEVDVLQQELEQADRRLSRLAAATAISATGKLLIDGMTSEDLRSPLLLVGVLGLLTVAEGVKVYTIGLRINAAEQPPIPPGQV